ncbi:hypothetical protein ACQJBY_065225 [Aegilops geniculata]
MLSASKPLLSPTSLTAMAIRLPPHAPTHYAPPHRRTPPFCSIARAAPSPSTTATAVLLPPSPKFLCPLPWARKKWRQSS